jgi:uridine kinase
MKKSIIIGISGGSGSGKTTFIKSLKHTFGQEYICVISQDDYYKPKKEQLIDANGIENFDLPTSIDLDAFVHDINELLIGNKVERKEYTFNNEASIPKIIVFKPAKVIIVEGLFIFHHEPIKELLDYSIIINAKDSDKIIRRILRDKTERNYPLEDVLYRYKNHVIPAYEKYIEPYIDEVDMVLNNNESYEKGVELLTYLVGAMIENQSNNGA